MIAHCRDGRASLGRAIFDRIDFLQQLGVAPPTEFVEGPVGRAYFWVAVNRAKAVAALGIVGVVGAAWMVLSSLLGSNRSSS
jgi:hypothetical protein